jgi:hypothetical protein
MKKIFRKLAIKFFSRYIIVLGVQSEISNEMLEFNKNVKTMIKQEMLRKIVDEMMKRELVTISEEDNIRTGGRRYSAKIRII